jgi:hypothetical protein
VATSSGKTDNPLLRCGDCRKAVYARESWRGRRHFYHFAGDHSDCRWSGAVAGNIRSIDGEKFQGQQEGEQHKTLSRFVADVLALDQSAQEAGIFLGRYTKLGDEQYAYPDVYTARWQGGPAAFEIQLATTHMPVIVRREAFYEKAGIRLVWIVGHQGEGLNRRAFRDIHMRNDGQILGMDGEVVAAAREAGEPRFRLYRLVPGSAREGFTPQWRDKIVAPDKIDWGGPGDRPRSKGLPYDQYLDEMIETDPELSALRQEFYDALMVADGSRARSTWNKVVEIAGGLSWDSLPSPYDDIRAMGVLATLRTGQLRVPSRIELANVPHLVNSMLLEPPQRRCWTHAFELLCRSKGLDGLLSKPSVREKCKRNKREAPGIPIDRTAGTVFNVFFPEGVFRRLTFQD